MEGCVDLKMGTLSKTIPSVGGYIAADEQLILYLKHAARAFVFSAALPPAAVAAAKVSFDVICEEQDRVQILQRNAAYLLARLKECGFNTLNSETPIVPVICGSEERAWEMARLSQQKGIFAFLKLLGELGADAAVSFGPQRPKDEVHHHCDKCYGNRDLDGELHHIALQRRRFRLQHH